MRVRKALFLLAVLALAALILLVACSGGANSTAKTSNTGSVTTTISDPSTCTAPQGPYSHIFLTVADVQIHQSATAAASDPGWVDLTPGLTPKQVDMLSTTSTSCFLATLGSGVSLSPGTY